MTRLLDVERTLDPDGWRVRRERPGSHFGSFVVLRRGRWRFSVDVPVERTPAEWPARAGGVDGLAGRRWSSRSELCQGPCGRLAGSAANAEIDFETVTKGVAISFLRNDPAREGEFVKRRKSGHVRSGATGTVSGGPLRRLAVCGSRVVASVRSGSVHQGVGSPTGSLRAQVDRTENDFPMRDQIRRAPFVFAAVALFGLLPATSFAQPSLYAQTGSYGQPAPTTEEIKSRIDSSGHLNPDPFDEAELKKSGITVGDVIILPSISIGTIFNDNVYLSNTNTTSGWGFGVQPDVSIKRYTGINNTTLSLYGNLLNYVDVPNANLYTGGARLSDVYEVERGLTVSYRGDVARRQDQQGAYSATGVGSGITSLNVEPITYLTYSSSLDVNKDFNSAFLTGGVGFVGYDYNNAQTTNGITISQSYRNLFEYYGHARAGVRFLSNFYAFVEPGVTQYQFTGSSSNATGYSVVGGVGTDRLGLFGGEVFAGYQSVGYGTTTAGNRDESGATFGGRVSWTPTRDLVGTVFASQSFTPSTVVSGSVGAFTKSDTVAATIAYAYSTKIDLRASVAYSNVNYAPNTTRDDKISQIGLNGVYYLLDSVGVRLQYSFTNVNSSLPIYNYGNNLVILSADLRL